MVRKKICKPDEPDRFAEARLSVDVSAKDKNSPGMNDRIRKLRKLSVETQPSLSVERALHETAFYKAHHGTCSAPVLRALNFLDHCQKKNHILRRG